MTNPGQPRTLSFQLRLTLYVCAIALIPLVLVGATVSSMLNAQLTSQVHGRLMSDAHGIERTLSSTISERQKNIESWAEDAILRGALIYDSFEKSESSLHVLHERYPEYRALVLFTADGHAVAASDGETLDLYARNQPAVVASPWFRAALAGAKDDDSLEAPDPILGERVLSIARPVVSPADGHTLGVLLGAYAWETQVGEEVQPAIDRAVSRGYRSFSVVITRPDGTILYEREGEDGGLRPSDVARLVNDADTNGVAQSGDYVANATKSFRDGGRGWVVVAVQNRAEAYAPVQRAVLVTVALIVLFGLAAVVLSFLMARRLVRPIDSLSRVVDTIVRDGDLTQTVVAESNDEIGRLASNFARMVEKLREILASLQESTRLLGDSVGNLGASTIEQRETINRQVAAVQETQITMHEIKQTSLLAAQKAEAVLKVAERADQVGKQGSVAIEHSLSGLVDIRAQVAEIADRITELTDRTHQIGLITEAVKDLADQSNMLALNAAIEAVRSGEHGKGFGVVAREIRSLADQSIQATNRVREILDDISSAIRTAVSITAKGADKMETGLTQVKASGESLRELSGIVTDNSAAVRQIAAAVSQQNAGITQISSAVNELNKLTDDTVARLEATTAANDVVKDVAARVSTIVASYRT
ncbi:MAG: methyl-accepting chemotaxis protein [Polyangiaceae bacterium]|nr:methyl-accepting chemotaxis protein [Polyangiaceae bacterium]